MMTIPAQKSVFKRVWQLGTTRSARILFVFCVLLCGCAVPSIAQQKGQWVPGQYGLNAGVIPDPGFTYQNLAINYNAGTLTNSSGNAINGITGSFNLWVDANIFMYVSKFKFLGARYTPFVSVNFANGSLVAEIEQLNLSAQGGAAGISDTYVVPVNLGWHFDRADITAGYGFFAPTGRYTPDGSDNIGSGYWGNHVTSGTTYYITKNKGTTANLFIDWESHGQKSGTDITPGQAFTTEWGFGQLLPLDKDMHKLLQIGYVGYDQWQVTGNQGTIASLLPYYSSHAMGFQTNFIAPVHGLNFFFKFYEAYSAKAALKGRTIVFGGSWTLRFPKK